MYPETDIPLMTIDADYINRIRLRLPELPEKRLERLMRDHKLNAKLAKQVLDSAYGEAFESIVKDSGVSATVVAAFLTETLKGLRRDGLGVDRFSEEQVREVFRFVGSGMIVKESLSDVVVRLLKNEGKSVQDAVDALGLKGVSESDVSGLVDKVIVDNAKLVQVRGEGSYGVLMGIIMRELRGKVDAARVANSLREKLKRAVQ
jgi:glutamyl-tRNA(Gln) amidotransferase subunit E